MTTATRPNERLKDLAISLPAVAKPVGTFLPYRRVGDLIFISGQVSIDEDGSVITGLLGSDCSIDEGTYAARRAGMGLLAVTKLAAGDLAKVRRVVKVNGYVRCTPDFADQPAVINGCSGLLGQIFGEDGQHARAAVGVASLPMGAAVEVEAIMQLRESE